MVSKGLQIAENLNVLLVYRNFLKENDPDRPMGSGIIRRCGFVGESVSLG